jgi:hypothetical protein
MFLHSRIVAIDDKEHHLKGIKDTLQELRLDCHSKLYSEEEVGSWSALPGTRVLLMDQNLTAGATFATGDKNNFATIADVIAKLIDPTSGPYGLVLWAETPQLEDLKNFLFERLVGEDAKLLPVFFAELKKGDYIDTSNGEIRDASRLSSDIIGKMTDSPQMRALLSWETDVIAAMDAVLRSIVDLVPLDVRGSPDFSNVLGKVLYRLSQAGSGVHRAMENPRDAINSVLVPILADRITEHDPQGDAGNRWVEAIVVDDVNYAPEDVQAEVNTAIHLSFARGKGSAPIQATDFGAVVKFPFAEIEQGLQNNFGFDVAKLRDKEFLNVPNDDEWQNCTIRLIEIGAACDHAQPGSGPLTYLLAVEWPFTPPSDARPSPNLRRNRKHHVEAEWSSPVLKVGANMLPGRISVFSNCAMTVPRAVAAEWKADYRFRDELVSQLTQKYARHVSRPGIVSLG